MLAGFLCRISRTLQVARIIERIKDTKYADSIISGGFYKRIDNIIGIVPVAQ